MKASGAAGVPLLLRDLVDDAGLFPPERLLMDEAVARHRADERGGHPMLTHRFLCPASRLGELREQVAEGDRFRLGLVADTGLGGLPAVLAEAEGDPRVVLDLVEVPLGPGEQPRLAGRALDALAVLPEGVAAYLEPRRGPGWLDAVRVVAAAAHEHGDGADAAGRFRRTDAVGGRRGAKVRCGGVRPELFPTSAELAAFVLACTRAQVAFKATAGLHHAIRYTDPATGFDHHGFLNLLVAVGLAVRGAAQDEIIAVLDCTDGHELVARTRALDEDAVGRARDLLVSYGSCSTSEPIDDVAELGLTEKLSSLA